jgi:hypothetical protein
MRKPLIHDKTRGSHSPFPADRNWQHMVHAHSENALTDDFRERSVIVVFYAPPKAVGTLLIRDSDNHVHRLASGEGSIFMEEQGRHQH